MGRVASIVLIAFVLVACGGGDDDDDDPPSTSAGSAPTATLTTTGEAAAVTTVSEATAGTTPETPSGQDTESAAGAPTHESSDFPDVQVPLEVGSSGEVLSEGIDPMNVADSLNPDAKVKVTINEILDPAVLDGTIFEPEAGNRWWAVSLTFEATGSAPVNNGIWTMGTADGSVHESLIVLSSTPDIVYSQIDPGGIDEGIVVFEIPEDAVVQWLHMDPSIFLGRNLVFVN